MAWLQALRQVAGGVALGGAAVMAGQLEAAVLQLGSVFDEVGCAGKQIALAWGVLAH